MWGNIQSAVTFSTVQVEKFFTTMGTIQIKKVKKTVTTVFRLGLLYYG